MRNDAAFCRRPAAARGAVSAAVVAVALVCAAFSGVLDAAVTVTGDQAAWNEIGAAFRRLERTTYRMTMTAPGQTMIVEHTPPDARRTITTMTGQVGEIESITVHGESRFRVIRSGASARWMCGGEGPQPPTTLTMDGVGMAVHVARRPDGSIGGARVREYLLTYTFRSKRAGHQTTLYVDRKTGLPRRSVTPYSAGAGTLVSTYYDYGVPMIIGLPPCG